MCGHCSTVYNLFPSHECITRRYSRFLLPPYLLLYLSNVHRRNRSHISFVENYETVILRRSIKYTQNDLILVVAPGQTRYNFFG